MRRLNSDDIFEDNLEDYEAVSNVDQPLVSFRQNGNQGGGIMVWVRDTANIQHSEVVVMPGSGVAKAALTMPDSALDALHVKVWMINSLRKFEVTTVYRHPGVRLQPTFAGSYDSSITDFIYR
jgi:hypothetical protein